MATTFTVPESFAGELKRQAKVNNRSIAKQIEHWLRIGKIAEENPDLSYEFIREMLLSLEEVADGQVSEYKFD